MSQLPPTAAPISTGTNAPLHGTATSVSALGSGNVASSGTASTEAGFSSTPLHATERLHEHALDEHHHAKFQHGTDFEQGVIDGQNAAPGSFSQVTHESEYNRGFKLGQSLKKGADISHVKHNAPFQKSTDYEQGLKDGMAAAPGSVPQVTDTEHEKEYLLGFKEGQQIKKKEHGHGLTAVEAFHEERGTSTGISASSGFPSTTAASQTTFGNSANTSAPISTSATEGSSSVYGQPDQTGLGPETKVIGTAI